MLLVLKILLTFSGLRRRLLFSFWLKHSKEWKKLVKSKDGWWRLALQKSAKQCKESCQKKKKSEQLANMANSEDLEPGCKDHTWTP